MDLNGQEEALTQFSERSNLSRMSSEPYLGPPGLQSSVCTAIYENQYPPSNYRYSSGLHYSQSMAPPSGRHGNRTVVGILKAVCQEGGILVKAAIT